MKKLRNKGFTLIELLVVIAIIGILSSVVLASLNTARQKSRDAKRISDIKQLQLALEFYFDANGNYPIALTTVALVNPGYIAVIPTPPGGTTDTAYKYAALGSGANCSSYHIGITLEDASHTVFDSDSDDAAVAVCTGSAVDFAGTEPIYDVIP
ncbi:MAG: prepilin-type N-terminal cleavage/methylation domain-containing protein [Patescibacteria group bacterium]|mgnify:CR=1 FL=1